MGKIAIYIFIILVFMGISKSFSPSDRGSIVIPNEQVFSHYFRSGPVSVILTNIIESGYFIKTYYFDFDVVYGFRPSQKIRVRTSENFLEKNKNNIGMSIFRKNDRGLESSTPMPPGTVYIGDHAYGNWVRYRNGKKLWRFHRPYRNILKLLRWGSFKPSYKFYKQGRLFLEQKQAFYGLNNEFGTSGDVTKKGFPKYYEDKKREKQTFKDYWKKLVKTSSRWVEL